MYIILAQNGLIALDFAKKRLPDLILLDIMMPEMDGFETCEKLKQEQTTKDIPIIFLTAKTEKNDIIKGLEAGAVDYVTKPFNSKELMSRVNTHLELKAAKEELNQKISELKQANATKDNFFSIIAHDLMNPLNALLTLSSLLATKNKQLTNDEREEFIQLILQASNKSYNLLKNLLEWSRSQTGKLKMIPVSLNLKYLVDKNIELLDSHAKSKNINIFSYIDAISVVADENTLDTVIRNLLSNAIKFTHANGKVEISAQKKGTEIEVSISDTGVGIKPQDIDKLFRIDVNHTMIGTGEEKGTGLGLILCKEFVEKNGGLIRVESEEGKGSVFYISLPFE